MAMQENTHRLVELAKSDTPYKRDKVILDWPENAMEPEEEKEWRHKVEAYGGYIRHRPPEIERKKKRYRKSKRKSKKRSDNKSKNGNKARESVDKEKAKRV